MKPFKLVLLILFLGILVVGRPCPATELVFEFVDPAFGGNPLNGTWLLNQANVQNQFEDPDGGDLNDFQSQLERRILSILSQRIALELLGEEGLPSGEFTIGDTIVEIIDEIDNITVKISDPITGEETTITLPRF